MNDASQQGHTPGAMLAEYDESNATHVWTGNFPALAEQARAVIAKVRGDK